MKYYLLTALLFSSQAFAGPTLGADPVSPAGPQPATAEWQVQGATTWQPCNLTGDPKIMTCDLVSLTSSIGPRTILARFNYLAGCNASGVCWAAGSAVSLPFSFAWTGVPAQNPTGVKVGTP
jgi:hypothetical protein